MADRGQCSTAAGCSSTCRPWRLHFVHQSGLSQRCALRLLLMQDFKAYNFDALGLPVQAGCLHPLLKVRPVVSAVGLAMCWCLTPAAFHLNIDINAR